MTEAGALDAAERGLVAVVQDNLPGEIAFLERVVDTDSGTFDAEGVRAVGQLFDTELRAIGFATRWADMPESMRRAGHLIAERVASAPHGPRMLLIGHLDTVFEGAGHRFERSGDVARGAGITDMKGGDVALLFALRALEAEGILQNATVRVFLTGDEENPGSPIEASRRDLIGVARTSDVALSFEPDSGRVAIGRRGLSRWSLEVSAAPGHSASVLRPGGGAGAVYEAARIVEGFRNSLQGRANITINPGLFLGGTSVGHDPEKSAGAAAGKFNVIASEARVTGDLRFVEEEERRTAQDRMREVAGVNLPRTSARLVFEDLVPGWPATDGNRRVLAVIDGASRDLGYGPLEADDPGTRGFGDFNFIGSLVPGADGLGVRGTGEHGPQESMDLRSLLPTTARAAVVISRLLRRRA